MIKAIGFFVVMLVLIVCALQVGKSQKRKLAKPQAHQVRQQDANTQSISTKYNAILANMTAWRNTITLTANSTMYCIANDSNPCPMGTSAPNYAGTFTLVDQNNIAVHDPDPVDGFKYYKLSGVPCSRVEYDDISPATADCAARVKLVWEPVCNAGATCLKPPIKVHGDFELNSKASDAQKNNFLAINQPILVTETLPVTVDPNAATTPDSESIKKACATMGGLWDSSSNICHMNSTPPPGEQRQFIPADNNNPFRQAQPH